MIKSYKEEGRKDNSYKEHTRFLLPFFLSFSTSFFPPSHLAPTLRESPTPRRSVSTSRLRDPRLNAASTPRARENGNDESEEFGVVAPRVAVAPRYTAT